MSYPKHVLKGIFQYFGYQVKEIPKALSREASFLHLDAFYDQQFILRKSVVNTIFDIGAHVGQTAQHYRKLFKDAKIISFEPFPDSYSKLVQVSQSLDRVETHNLAVDERSGDKSFYSTSFSAQNSLLKLTEAVGEYYNYQSDLTAVKPIQVKTTSLDDFCKSRDIQKIQICKMDVQGAELLALKGAVDLLANKAIDLLYLEVCFSKYYQDQALFYQIYDFLAGYNYSLFGLYNLYHGKNNLALVEGDALFVNHSLVDSL